MLKKTIYHIMRQELEGLKDPLLDFAQRLVQIPSPSTQETQVAGLIAEQMAAMGYERVLHDDFGNVVGLMLGREISPTILLTCHMDTVAPGEESLWRFPATSGVIENGKLHGCGASDCKSGLAAQVFAGALLRRAHLPLQGNLIVAATVAEELGGSIGVRGLINKTLPDLELQPDWGILGEPTELGLYYGHEGWIELEVTVRGSDPLDVDDTVGTVFERLRSHTSGAQMGKLSPKTISSCEENGLRRARFSVYQRFWDSEQIDRVISNVKNEALLATKQSTQASISVSLCKQTHETYTGIRTTVEKKALPWETNPFHPIMAKSRHALDAAGCHVRSGKWQLKRMHTGTAGGVLVNEYGIPTLGYGPGCEAVIHGPGEYVEIDKIIEAALGTAAIIHKMIGVPVFGPLGGKR